MTRIIIADDHKLVREAWSMLLRRDKRLDVIAICESGLDVTDYIVKNEADVILMDINMEPVNGIEATKAIRKFNQQIKIIGISVHTDLPYVKALMEAGANGYVTKNSSGAEMIQAIFQVIEGNVFYCKEIASLQKNSD